MADKSVAQATLKNRRLTSASCIQQAKCAPFDEPGPPRPVCTEPSTSESGVITGWKAKMQVTEAMPTTRRPRNHAARWYRLVSWLFAREAVREAVATRIHLNANPEMVWNHIMLYEEVPGQPPFLLRALLPHPVRTEGDKTRVGAMVRCTYREGDLVKRIASVEPPHFLQFEVIEQRLGIEGCTLTLGGSYQIHPCGDAADVLLTTNYRAYLRPRFLWRPLEVLMVGQLHNHILDGVRAILPTNRGVPAAVAESLTPQCASPGGLACIASQSCSRR
jgi:hypothetical protein